MKLFNKEKAVQKFRTYFFKIDIRKKIPLVIRSCQIANFIEKSKKERNLETCFYSFCDSENPKMLKKTIGPVSCRI